MNARTTILTASAILLLLHGSFRIEAAAGEKSGKAPATCARAPGLLLRKLGEAKWESIAVGAPVPADLPLVAFPEALLHSADGSVALDMVADLAQRGPFPVLETSVRLHAAPPNAALSFSFDRGMVILENLRKEGPATVQVRACGRTAEIELLEPGTRIGLETYSRYAPGTPLQGKVEEPGQEFVLLILKGRAFLKGERKAFGMQAPPGQALLQWDSLFDEAQVHRLEKLPPGAAPPTPLQKLFYARVALSAQKLRSGERTATLKKLLHDKNWADRLVGVTLAGALEDLPTLVAALEDEHQPDVRDHAVLVLRHWLGRGPQDLRRLYEALVGSGKYSRAQALTLLQLLLGFPAPDLARPATYQVLLTYLDHSKVGIRELARWHLVRLAPQGRDIAYDAAAPDDRREEALRRWRKLIPEGKLPGATP